MKEFKNFINGEWVATNHQFDEPQPGRQQPDRACARSRTGRGRMPRSQRQGKR
ncbi:hypothetical protein ACU4GD_03345 [Cupriavidus basilensis]